MPFTRPFATLTSPLSRAAARGSFAEMRGHATPILLLALLLAQTALASPASERVAAMVRAGDYETAARDTAADASDVELAAWHIVARLRTSDGTDEVEAARALTAAHPENPWTWFALVHALENETDLPALLDASAKMLELAGPDAPSDMIALRAGALLSVEKKDEARKLLDVALARRPNDAALLIVRGDSGDDDEALRFYTRAESADPNSFSAWSRGGSALLRRRRAVEAVESLQHATELSPRALFTRQVYWRALHALTELTPAQKQMAIEADLTALALVRGDLPSTYAAIAREYHQLKLEDRACEAAERVLRDAPHSAAAASVLYARAQDFRQGKTDEELEEPGNRAEYRRLLHAVVDDPQRSTSMHGSVYISLLGTMRHDPGVPAAELRAAVEALERYDRDNPTWRFAVAPAMLADRGVALDYAESLARRALPALSKEVENDRTMYPSGDDYRKGKARVEAMAHDALGWVLLARKKPAEAKKELLAAYRNDPQVATVLYHLGRYYESRGLLEKAEDSFIKGSLIPTPDQNENRDALKALYRRRHGGSLAGFEAYRKTFDGTDASKRKRKVLAERNAAPQTVAPFKLATLGGAPLALDDLKGKVAVISFWGIWCTWCVRELPDFQTLVRKYAKDPTVRIVTVNNDGDVDKVRDWMSAKKFEFPVLLDDGWLGKVNLHSFPTTWFLDRSGKIAFTKTGWTEKLVDEFTWRIEALKSEKKD
jgi:tetratricopeptide (TPR) repeat protein